MNQEVKTKWIQALRSGKYKQGFGVLRGEDCYCCLGVLCDLNEDTDWEVLDNPVENIYKPFPDNSYICLPNKISEWAEITARQEDVLATLNDTARYTFEQIADYIEENL